MVDAEEELAVMLTSTDEYCSFSSPMEKFLPSVNASSTKRIPDPLVCPKMDPEPARVTFAPEIGSPDPISVTLKTLLTD